MAHAKKTKSVKENLQQENVLEAVVVADRFDSRFRPITDELPLALFPLVNRPILAYTLDFLASCGIQKIYVYCCQHAQLIKDFLAKSKWNSRSSTLQVHVIVSSDSTSLGDILRDVDQKALFETDFLLVPGDLVSNMSIKKALEEHSERRKRDKNKPLMTLFLRNSTPAHLERIPDDDVIIALNASNQQILYYQNLSGCDRSKIKIPSSTFLNADCSKFDLRYDVTDTGVAICSPQVPQLFTDNFDYQTREDFIRGILINEEFLGNQIHVHTVQRDFVSRVSAFHTYDTVSRAVLSRWVYPFVPDNDFESVPQPDTSKSLNPDEAKEIFLQKAHAIYCHLRRNVYVGQVRSMGKNNTIEDNSIIGHNVTIGSNCRITNSVIGCDCEIGDDVIIEDSYLWQGVVVKKSCKLKKAIVCMGSVVHENCCLEKHCILSIGVQVGPDITVDEDSVIYNYIEDDAFGDAPAEKKRECDPIHVGAKGRGLLWSCKEDPGSDDETEVIIKDVWGMSLLDHNRRQSVGAESVSSGESDSSQESDGFGDTDDKSDEEDSTLKVFYREVKDSLTRGVEENINSDNLVLEINSSKYAYNVTILDIMYNITKALFEIAFMKTNNGTFIASFKKILRYLSPVFANYNKSAQAQMECLNAIESYCLQNKHASDCLIKILMALYEGDILAEEVILLWHRKAPQEPFLIGHITQEQLRISVKKFIDWLQEAEEESSDDGS